METSDNKETSTSATLRLPPAPASETGSVKAWEEAVTMLTYHPAQPDKNPLFLEKRVYQGSSGRVYPLPVIDSIETVARPHTWKAVHLENEYLRLMVLPEIGGRIHVGLDKRNNYDFFYRQNAIKPALVGLAGPWVSGGVEFNWPQHHRPATYMPVEVAIEREADGAVTVWCSDHDPMVRLKGMHGLRLRPGKALLELRVRLYNRTEGTQTFLWWANVATHVHEKYQSFFPHDVRFAADHAKRAITEYPLSQGTYYGIDYGERGRKGVPPEEMPSHFIPDGTYPPNDLGWYANIPVPTSYMIVNSRGDFSGGYDHKRRAGTLAVANHHIAPGKKQWTWGNHEFGYAWDRCLTDSDGPYVELMSGVYTDNQPDFSFLAPGETKSFSQFWYPISEIGVPDHANTDAALRVEVNDHIVRVHLQVTAHRTQSSVRVLMGGKECGHWKGDLAPDSPLDIEFERHGLSGDLEVVLKEKEDMLLRYAPAEIVSADPPVVATEPALPESVESSDELFLVGLHLEQYRHPTRLPESYWMEAIRRDPGDSRCNHAMGTWHLRRCEFTRAEIYLRTSIERLTRRNPNPSTGAPHYHLGMTLLYQGHIVEAYDAFYKSTWNADWKSSAYHRLAEIDCSRREWTKALEHLKQSLRGERENLNARNLMTIVLRRLDRTKEASALLEETRALDPLDIFSRWLESAPPQDGQQRLDLVFDLLRAGLEEEALTVLSAPHSGAKDGTDALLLYVEADVLHRLDRAQESAATYRRAAAADPDYVFPSRIEEFVVLNRAVHRNPEDARARFYLGNLLYDRRRHEEAIALWEGATELDPSFPTAWRNLAFGYFNVRKDSARALRAFERARECSPCDARLLYEQDQLLKRTGEALERRLATLEANQEMVARRDDLSIELASLYNSTGEPKKALALLLARKFQPWEGGEGLVLGQYVRANVLLAQRSLQEEDAPCALEYLHAAQAPPENLSEAKHLLMNQSIVDYSVGVAHAMNGNRDEARAYWQKAARAKGDFQRMRVQPVSEMTYWSAMALEKLGEHEEGQALFRRIYEYACSLSEQTPEIDYFATSLPAMLLFDEDLKERQTITSRFLMAQALLGRRESEKGFRLLKDVLAMDRSHTDAIDLLKFSASESCSHP